MLSVPFCTIRTSKSELVRQLIEEALGWRKANRTRTSGAWKPPRGKPFQLPPTSLAIADISGRRAGFGLSASQAPPFRQHALQKSADLILWVRPEGMIR